MIWKEHVRAEGSAKRYVQQFISELNNGGVCSLDFYVDLIDNSLAQLDDDFDFHTRRWGVSGPGPNFRDAYIEDKILPKLTSMSFMRDFVMSLHKGQPVEPDFVRGDADLDGDVDVDDVTHILNYLFDSNGLVNFCFLANSADVDDDGAIEFEDASKLFAFLKGTHPEPEAPYPDPGEDTTPSQLDW